MPRGRPIDPARDTRAQRFAVALAEVLHAMHITHRVLATELGLGVFTIDSWTRGVDPKLPGPASLSRLCAVLNRMQSGAGDALRDIALGTRRLAVSPPIHNAEVSSSGPEADHQPRGNLPPPTNTLFGREKLLTDIAAHYGAHRGAAPRRLLTLIGAGGVGKTRLALHAARILNGSYAQGAWLIELAPLTDAAQIAPAIARALGMTLSDTLNAMDQVCDQLALSERLLLIDNCEHLIWACAQLVQSLLTRCPRLHLLITSREPLRLDGETVWRVPQLSLPDLDSVTALDADSELGLMQVVRRSDAVRLFVDRAGMHLAEFELTQQNVRVVAEICSRLDGIPLALELAAVRVMDMTVDELLAGLSERFALLTHGSRAVLPRQQTLRATFDWSHALLTPEQQQLFASLSVFAGGWPAAALSHVHPVENPLEMLASLVHKSLVWVDRRPIGTRYQILESVREYARVKLRESGLEQDKQQRHAHWCLSLAQKSAVTLLGPDQLEALAVMDMERPNLHIALSWVLDVARDAALGLALAGALRTYWLRRALYREGHDFASRALALATLAHSSPEQCAAVALCVGMTAFYQAQYRSAKLHVQVALDAALGSGAIDVQALAQDALAQIAMYHDAYDEAVLHARAAHALFMQGANVWGMATAQLSLGYALGRMARSEEIVLAMQRAFKSAQLGFQQCGDRFGMGAALNGLGGIELHFERYAVAQELYQQSLAVLRQLNDQEWISRVLNNLAECCRGLGDKTRAIELCNQALEIRLRLGAMFGIANLRNNLGRSLADMQQFDPAMENFKLGLRLNLGYGDASGVADSACGIAGVWVQQSVRMQDAARVLAFAAAPLGYPGLAFSGPDRHAYEHDRTVVRASLGDMQFEQLQAEGGMLTQDAIGALVLSDQG